MKEKRGEHWRKVKSSSKDKPEDQVLIRGDFSARSGQDGILTDEKNNKKFTRKSKDKKIYKAEEDMVGKVEIWVWRS